MDLGLDGRSVVVMGAGSGLGRASALGFAREGAVMTLFGRDQNRLDGVAGEIVAGGGTAPVVVPGDITDPGSLDTLMARAGERTGAVDALFTNGGGPRPGTFADFADADWQAGFELTLLGYIRAIRAALPYLRASDAGRIVNNTTSGVKAAIDGLVLSNVFRMGVIGLTKTLAGELAGDGILVNAIAPGRISTDRVAALDATRAARTGSTVDDVRAKAEASIPVGRYGEPAEFARSVVFHGSPANSYVTGQVLLVDGGMYRGY
jgi:3-oxoacyl-[acyl-carrier protein] reductase